MSNNNDYIKDFFAPWETRRGMDEMLLYNYYHIYFKCKIQDLQTIFIKKTKTLITDALDKNVLIDHNFAIAFQLQGHAWSTLIPCDNYEDVIDQEFLKTISAKHNIQVITLRVSEVAWRVEYTIFDNGNIVEYFLGSQDDSGVYETEFLTTRHQLCIDDEEPDSFQTAYFYSVNNNINIPSNSTICTFPSKRFVDYDLYAPEITIEYFLGSEDIEPGVTCQLKSNGMSVTIIGGEILTTYPSFNRVDFYVFH